MTVTAKKIRVLLAEEGPGEATESLRALYPPPEHELDLTVVSTVSNLLPTIKVVSPEVMLLDLALARPEPLDAVRRVHRAAPGIPLIVVADSADKENAAQSLSEGAMDYLLKGFINTSTLGRVIRTALERNTIEGLADLMRDPVTRLHDREAFVALASQHFQTAQRRGGTLALFCVALEDWPSKRAEFGAITCDAALKRIAELLTGCIRRTDLNARMADAEFAVLAVDAMESSVPMLRQRLEKNLSLRNETRWPWADLVVRVSAEFWSSTDSRTFDELLGAAQTGLRRSSTPLPSSKPRRQQQEAPAIPG